MALSDVQFRAVISGVRSICDELLKMDPVVENTDLSIPPGGRIPPARTTPPALKIVGNPETPPTGAAQLAENPPTSPPTGPPPVKLDAEGLPWDERIHTAKKSELKSGVWRIKPGVDAVLVAKVKTELTLAAQITPGASPPANQSADQSTGNPPANQSADQGTGNPPTDPGTNTGVAMSWSDLLTKIVNAGKTPEEVLAACTACNIENIGKLQDVPAMIPNVAVALGV